MAGAGHHVSLTAHWRQLPAIVAALMLTLAGAARSADRPTVLLDGRWDFRFAPDDRGTTERWFDGATPFDRTLNVPGCWDAQGVGDPTDKMRHNAIGVGWYRRTFTVPDEWRGKHVWLVIGGVHRTARVYVNGQQVAAHIGYPVAFRLDLTDRLTPGREQSLVIAVDSRPDPARDPLVGTFDVIDYMDLTWGGIFEHVRLEATGETWIDEAFVRPDPSKRRAEVDLSLDGTGGDADASYVVRTASTNRTLATGTVPIHNGRATFAVDLPDAPLWTPADPYLLTLELTLSRNGTPLDQRLIRFGLRRLEARGGRFVLNGDPVFLRGYGDDFNFPRELLPPADISFWKPYLQKRRDFGFTYARHHSMMPTESYLSAADEVGMLVQPELPIAYMEFLAKAKGKALDVYGQVWRDYIRQMRNHPSVMSWCMGNEQLFGPPFRAEFYDAAKRLDPTRPVIDSDGLAAIDTDRPTLDYRAVQFDEHVIPWGATRNKYANPHTAKPTIVHEMANLSCLPDPTDADAMDGAIRPFWLKQMRDAVKRQHLEDALPAMLRASWRYQASLIKLNAEAARLGPGIAGYEQWLFRDYWTQSTGIESITGTTRALTADQCRQFNADAVLLWDHDRVNFVSDEPIPLNITLSDFRPSSAPRIDRVTARLFDLAVTLQAPPNASGRGAVGPWTSQFRAPVVPYAQRFTLSADAGGVHNDWPVWIWPPAPKPERSDLLVARRLTADVLQKLESGSTVFLTDDAITFPTQTATFKPAWWKGDEHADFVHGNYFTDHPALAGFPHDGYGDLQCFGLLNDRPVTNLDQLPGTIRPIVWALDVPWKLRRMAYLWEARVGRGKLLVSCFDLSPQRRQTDPAAAWMYVLLTRYAAGPSFQPAATLPADWLRQRVDALSLPDLTACIEGFDRVAVSTAEQTTWFTDREPAAPLYVVRQTDGGHVLTWSTAPLPPNWPHDTATFVWSGGIGFRSQPDAGPFRLSLDGRPLCTIPFTPTSAEWPCAGGGILRYLVLRHTNEDTAGLFFLTLPKSQLLPRHALSLTLSTPGKGSRRWITVAPYRDALRSLRGE